MLRQIDFALDTFLPDSTIGLKALIAQQSSALGNPYLAFATFAFHTTNATSGLLVAYFPDFTYCTKILHLSIPTVITTSTKIIPSGAPYIA